MILKTGWEGKEEGIVTAVGDGGSQRDKHSFSFFFLIKENWNCSWHEGKVWRNWRERWWREVSQETKGGRNQAFKEPGDDCFPYSETIFCKESNHGYFPFPLFPAKPFLLSKKCACFIYSISLDGYTSGFLEAEWLLHSSAGPSSPMLSLWGCWLGWTWDKNLVICCESRSVLRTVRM